MLRPDQETCRYCQGNKRIVSPQIKTLAFSPDPRPAVRLEEHWVTCPYCGGLGWRLVGVGR